MSLVTASLLHCFTVTLPAMKDPEAIKRVALPISFFGALVAMLMFSESIGPTQATVSVTGGDAVRVPALEQELPTCNQNADCPLPTTYCADGYCTRLTDPICDCSKPNVLRCYEKTGRARFLYCQSACVETGDGAICQ